MAHHTRFLLALITDLTPLLAHPAASAEVVSSRDGHAVFPSEIPTAGGAVNGSRTSRELPRASSLLRDANPGLRIQDLNGRCADPGARGCRRMLQTGLWLETFLGGSQQALSPQPPPPPPPFSQPLQPPKQPPKQPPSPSQHRNQKETHFPQPMQQRKQQQPAHPSQPPPPPPLQQSERQQERLQLQQQRQQFRGQLQQQRQLDWSALLANISHTVPPPAHAFSPPPPVQHRQDQTQLHITSSQLPLPPTISSVPPPFTTSPPPTRVPPTRSPPVTAGQQAPEQQLAEAGVVSQTQAGVHSVLPEEVALSPTLTQPQTPTPDDQSLPMFLAAAADMARPPPPPPNRKQQPQTHAPTITTFPVTLAEIAAQLQQDPASVAAAQSPMSATVPSSNPLLPSLMPTLPSLNASQISFKSLRSLLAPAQLKLSDILGPLGIDLGALNSLPLATTANQQQQQLQHSLDDRAHQQADQQHDRDNAAFLAMLAVRSAQAQAQQGGGAAPNLKLNGLVARAPAPAPAAVVTVDTGVKIADLFPGKGSG
ncbi:MAG: hypothetical protein WDW38_008834 [Sanguina aurantia]